MEEVINKRKINFAITLEGTYIHSKTKQISNSIKEESNKTDKDVVQKSLPEKKPYVAKVSPFQLVVIKLPWYKRAVRGLLSLLGFYYD